MSGDKMNWMYKGLAGHVDPEEYLKGRKVDKTFELIRSEVEPQKSHFDVDSNVVPPSLLRNDPKVGTSSITGQVIVPNVTVDIESKLREDPLYEIRKKEIEKRKEYLMNPVKLKRMQKILKKSLESSSDTDSSSSSSDDRRKRKSSKRSKDVKHKRSRRDERSSSADRRHKHSTKDRKRSEERKRSDDRKRSEDDDRKRHSHHSAKDDKKKSSSFASSRSFASSSSSSSKYQKPKPPQRPKLSAEELEKKRIEMMADAKDRDKERKERVLKYKEDEAKDNDESNKIGGSSFVKPLLKDKIERESIESSVRQKVFSSQRGQGNMDKNFARR